MRPGRRQCWLRPGRHHCPRKREGWGFRAGVISCCCGAEKRAAEGDAAGIGRVVGGVKAPAGGARDGAGMEGPAARQGYVRLLGFLRGFLAELLRSR